MSLCHTLARHFRLYRAAAEGAQKYIDEIPDGLEFWACGSTVAAFAYDFDVAGGQDLTGPLPRKPQATTLGCCAGTAKK